LEKNGGVMWHRFIWIRTGPSSGLQWNTWSNIWEFLYRFSDREVSNKDSAP